MSRIDRIEDPTPEDRAAILAPLEGHGRDRGFVWRPEPLVLALRDDGGAIVGGLTGMLLWDWLRVDILAVDEGLRGRGWGTRLLAEAEAIAGAAGCRHAWLDTFSFQARPFYERHGYRVFGELADFPRGQARYFLAKDLGGGPPASEVRSAPPLDAGPSAGRGR